MKAVYIASAGRNRVKVGISANPAKRLRSLSGASGYRLTLAASHATPDAAAVERVAHWLLRAARLHGEWFKIDAATAQAAVTKAIAMIEAGEGIPVEIDENARHVPGPAPQDLETILGRYPRGTGDRIKRVLGEKAEKGAQAELLREALDRELKRRERTKRREDQG